MRRVAALLCLLLAAGCTSGGSAGPGRAPTTPRAATHRHVYRHYVALGDSYTAGPFVPTTQLARGCFRSTHDYPADLARRLGAHLVDASCTGATTADVTGRQTTFRSTSVAPQLRAVTPRTDLVTIGLGGNDFDVFSTVVGTCTRLRSKDPTGAPCTRELGATRPGLFGQIATIGQRLAAVVHAVRRRAPHARVLLVGYLTLAPETGRCAALPLAAGDYALARRVQRNLADAQRSAARASGATYVDVSAVSAGHDVCSVHPWVNGRTTDQTRALAFHPFASGMRAVAARVAQVLRAG